MGPRDSIDAVKIDIRAMSGYTLAQPDCPVKLNQNECPFDVPEGLKRTILEEASAANWGRYPDFVPTGIKTRIAERHGVSPDWVLIGNGSNELIQAAFLATVGAGSRVVISVPTFSLYALMNTVTGGGLHQVPLREDMTFDVERLIETAASPETKLVVLCSPNNPTGSCLDLSDIERIAHTSPGLIVIDEAYHEFGGETAVRLLKDHPNLIVTRTFSKALGAAGLRIGYSLANSALTQEIEKVKLPYNVNLISLIATRHLLDEQDTIDERVALIVAERERVNTALSNLPGITTFPSQANFVLFRLDEAVESTFHGLIERGVLIRDVSHYPKLDRCMRVTIGTHTENTTFLEALTQLRNP